MIVLKNTPINQIFYILRNSKNGSGCWDLTHSNVEYNSNGTFTIAPPEGYDGLSSVTVKVDVKCSGITTSESEINSSNDGGDYTIGISSGYSWTATASEDWITVTPSSGEGGVAVITITVSENEGEERTGTVTIVNDNGDVNVIEITQEAGQIDYSKIAFTLEILEPTSLQWVGNQTIKYSINGQEWTDWIPNTRINDLNEGDCVYVKGYNNTYYHSHFDTRAKSINVSGNIMSLIDGDNFANLKEIVEPNAFTWFFNNFPIVSAENLVLPATTLSDSCYHSMFASCKVLQKAPKNLPATILSPHCYQDMFTGCSALTEAPTISATTMAEESCQYMFNHCSSLKSAPNLSATTLAKYCYYGMFGYCTSLTQAPELPATALADYCYRQMFRYCTSLTTAPELPATKLDAYNGGEYYNEMFFNCSSLNYIKCLATNVKTWNISGWVSGVSPTGTFVCPDPSIWTTGTDGIPSGWTVETI